MTKFALSTILIFFTYFSFAQEIIDTCFTSVDVGTDFISSADLANNSSIEADVLEWTGTDWVGGWPTANLTIAPPGDGVGCRAIFIGNGQTWTSGGEGFGLRLSESMIAGQTYSFTITYVSHGVGSDGAFAPTFFTNDSPTISGATDLGLMPAVGFDWETHTFTFTATVAQAGHNWILIHSGLNGSSGLINSFCESCQDCDSFPQTFSFGPDVILCQGSTLTLDATTANSSYLWQDGSSDSQLTVSQAGSYWVAITNDCGVLTDSINVSFGSQPQPVDLGSDVDLCQGETLLLDATASNVNYLWQDGSSGSTFLVTQPGTYSVEVSNGCGSATDEITITYTNPPDFDFGNDISLCDGETLTLDAASENAIYLWQDGSTNSQFLVTQAGNYTVQVENDCGMLTESVNVSYLSPPEPIDLGADADLCDGETLLLDVTASNVDYLWQDNSTNPTFTVDQPGMYSVEVYNDCGSEMDDISVSYINPPQVDLGTDITACDGDSITLDVSGTADNYLWQDNSTTPFQLVTTSGDYWVEVSNQCGSVADTVIFQFNGSPSVALGNDTTLCLEKTLLLDAFYPDATYLWQDGSVASNFLVSAPGIYEVTITNDCGDDHSNIIVDYENCVLCDIYIPNVFQPE